MELLDKIHKFGEIDKKVIDNISFQEFDCNLINKFYLSNIDNSYFIFDETDLKIISYLKSENSLFLNDITLDQIENRFKKYIKIGIIKINNTNNNGAKKSSFLLLKKNIINSNLSNKIGNVFKVLLNSYFFLLIISYFLFIFFYFIKNYSILIKYYSKADFLPIYLLIPLIYLGMLFHEIGHCSALVKFGQKTKGIGIGIYYYYLVFYSNLDNAWLLKRKERILVNLSGFIFQFYYFIFINIIFLIFFKSMLVKLYLLIIIEIIGMIFNFNPFLKFDGYWVLSDSLGIPNLSNYQILLIKYFAYDVKKIFTKKTKQFEYCNTLIHMLKKNIRAPFIFYSIFSNIFMGYFYFFIFHKIIHFIDDYTYDIIKYLENLFLYKKFYFNNSIVYELLFLIFIFLMIIRLVKKLYYKIYKRKKEG